MLYAALIVLSLIIYCSCCLMLHFIVAYCNLVRGVSATLNAATVVYLSILIPVEIWLIIQLMQTPIAS